MQPCKSLSSLHFVLSTKTHPLQEENFKIKSPKICHLFKAFSNPVSSRKPSLIALAILNFILHHSSFFSTYLSILSEHFWSVCVQHLSPTHVTIGQCRVGAHQRIFRKRKWTTLGSNKIKLLQCKHSSRLDIRLHRHTRWLGKTNLDVVRSPLWDSATEEWAPITTPASALPPCAPEETDSATCWPLQLLHQDSLGCR
jgi:hypothetical protein